ncbi:DNA-binding protein [Schnuerera sp. xch1]|uniref:DNA-binding protein n=1 Tax=Schnuerera sp. xch1 TaxID=2874283 RepID=UPI001CBE449F|nr:DNA-binding protein [Schnuerera sp. xch1]MBZ2174352.1 DNA-binding protein [Schnuerera sp. xch1]
MNYMSAQEAADKWGITKRRVQILCSENRIEGAEKMGNMWIIPKDANKPEDRRTKKEKKRDLKCTRN